MGMFFGYTGSLLILSAAAGVILRFLTEVKLVKKGTIHNIIKCFLISTSIGLIYLAFIAYIRTCFSSPVNMFDFAALFPDIEIREGIIGKIVFDEYAAAAGAVSFLGAWVFVYILFILLKRLIDESTLWDTVIFVVLLPGFFMLYSPSYISLICAAAALIIWILSKRIKISVKSFFISPRLKIAIISVELIINALCIYTFAMG